jgi:PTH1 family peptidyl-tRNA hydrolase
MSVKLIVGLGNPGAEYDGTRHNVGFSVADELARRWHVRWKSWKSAADVAAATARETMIVKPRTFMNASGEAVGRLAAFYKTAPADILVIVDEVQLPLGRLRLRRSGSAGGHNGLKSVIQHVGADFARLRVGVGRGDPKWDLADHVLSTFTVDERAVAAQTVTRAADAAETFVTEGIEAAMNTFNAAGDKGPEEEVRQ